VQPLCFALRFVLPAYTHTNRFHISGSSLLFSGNKAKQTMNSTYNIGAGRTVNLSSRNLFVTGMQYWRPDRIL